MQISHQEARTLIQYSLERSLSKGEKGLLDVHLEYCMECNTFVNEMIKVEISLKTLANQYASIKHIPLDINAFTRKPYSKIIWFPQLVSVSIIFMIFMIGAWQFSQTDRSPVVTTPRNGAPIPTPSITLTNTNALLQNCQYVNYIIKEGDTLESIANQFNVAQELIQNENSLLSTNLKAGTELVIPFCNITPSLTINPSTFTITTAYSPTTVLTAYTP